MILEKNLEQKKTFKELLNLVWTMECRAGFARKLKHWVGSDLKNLLFKFFEGTSSDFNFLEVRFDNPGASSLNLMVVIHLNGKCPDPHEENRREIQMALVQFCNTNNLTTPFNQLTINMADGTQDSNPLLG